MGGHEDTRISPHTGATQAASNLRIEARHPGAGAFPETGARLDAEAPPSPPLWSARGWGQCQGHGIPRRCNEIMACRSHGHERTRVI